MRGGTATDRAQAETQVAPRPARREHAPPWPSLRGLGRQWQDALLRRMLALADSCGVILVAAALPTFLGGDLQQGLWFAASLPLWIVLAKVHGLYDRDQRSLRHLTADEIPAIFMWALTGTAAVLLLMLLVPSDQIGVATGFRIWAIVGSAAFVFRGLMRWTWRRVTPAQEVLIVGEGPLADATRRKIDLFPDMHLVLAGALGELRTGELRQNPDWAKRIDRIILAAQEISEDLIAELLSFCRKGEIKLGVVPPARGMFGTSVQLNHVADLPVVEYNTWAPSRSTEALKRMLDIAGSLVALILLSPVFLLIALAIAVDSRGPILFTQLRAGLKGRPFRLYKFRTMVKNAEDLLPELISIKELPEPVFKLPNDPRMTRVGRFLRRTSLDELPQLWNVLRGEMSLVGPRPEELEIVAMYAPEHRFRLDARPGITGPMQIYGRGALGFDERLAVERDYIENLSIPRDLRILVLTLATVFTGRGAY